MSMSILYIGRQNFIDLHLKKGKKKLNAAPRAPMLHIIVVEIVLLLFIIIHLKWKALEKSCSLLAM